MTDDDTTTEDEQLPTETADGAADGARVYGNARASEGERYGVYGETDAADGQGLYTPGDAKVGGTVTAARSQVRNAAAVRNVPPGASAQTIQNLIDEVHAETPPHGFGVVVGRGDETYDIDTPLVQRSNVFIRDARFRQADGANLDAVIKSANFDTLTGTENEGVADGVPYHFGLFNVSIDGNRERNTTGAGVKYHGKALVSDGVHIWNCPDGGWLTELGADATNADIPKVVNDTTMGRFFVKNCGGHGWVYRGPHDGYVRKVVSSNNGGAGVRVTNDNNGIANATHFVELHPWGNNENFVVDAPINADWLYADGDPLDITKPCTIGAIKSLYDATVTIDATTSVGRIDANGNEDEQRDGVVIAEGGSKSAIGHVDARRFLGDGVVVDANQVTLSHVVAVRNGGYGINFAPNTLVNNANVNATALDKNGTAGFVYRNSGHNVVTINSWFGDGSTAFDVSNSVEPAPTDEFNLSLHGGGTNVGESRQRIRTTLSGDGSTTSFTVSHDLFWEPAFVTLTPVSSDALGAAPVRWDAGNTTDTAVGIEFASPPASGTDNVDVVLELTMDGR